MLEENDTSAENAAAAGVGVSKHRPPASLTPEEAEHLAKVTTRSPSAVRRAKGMIPPSLSPMQCDAKGGTASDIDLDHFAKIAGNPQSPMHLAHARRLNSGEQGQAGYVERLLAEGQKGQASPAK